MTGEILTRERNPIGDGFWTGTTWNEDTAYLTVRNLYAVDLNTGEIRGVWPLDMTALTVE